MSTCSKIARLVPAALVLAGAVAHPVVAQRSDARMVTVMTFQSPEKGLGAQAADMLRDRLAKDFSQRTLTVRPTSDVQTLLEASGFVITDPLGPTDEKLLARNLGADLYITGTITHTSAGYRIEPRLVLPRETLPSQPLPVQQSSHLDDAVADVSHSLHDAIKQLNGERQCLANAGQNKVHEALAAANAATAAYPAATLSRLCAQNIYVDLYRKATTHADSVAYADSALAVASQILHYDSLNTSPLRVNVEFYKFRGDSAKYRASLLQLIKADPTNTSLVTSVVNELASSGHADEAKPLVKDLLDQSPGDPQLLRLAFAVYSAAKDWTAVVGTGAELARADTSAADSLYFIRMAAAYDQMKDPAKTAEVLAQSVAKFPNMAFLWSSYGTALDAIGQHQQAVEAFKKAGQLDPRYRGLLLRPVVAFEDAKQYDSAYVALQQALGMGADSVATGQLATKLANDVLRAASPTKDRTQFHLAIRFGQLANQVASTPLSQFMTGAAAFSLMQSAATEANTTKSCPLAREAHEAYLIAQPALATAAKDPTQGQAAAMGQYVAQFRPAIESQIKQFCK